MRLPGSSQPCFFQRFSAFTCRKGLLQSCVFSASAFLRLLAEKGCCSLAYFPPALFCVYLQKRAEGLFRTRINSSLPIFRFARWKAVVLPISIFPQALLQRMRAKGF
jgi:hypothetical protein